MKPLDRVVQALLARNVPHALIGAAALAAHGIARSTYDIDLLTTDVRVLEPATWRALQDEGVTVQIRRGDADDPLGGVVRVEAPGERPVDVILGKHAWQARAVERADRRPGAPPIVTARDLILLKLYAGGTQDLWDIRELLASPDAAQLIADVESDLREHAKPMRERWAAARR